MQSLDPQKIETKDALDWLQQSLQLINRHLISYATTAILFFVSLLVINQAIQFLLPTIPALPLLLLFLFAAAFVFYFFVASLVMISYGADHSEAITIRIVIQQFAKAQRSFLTMTVLTLMIGVFYWYASSLSNPDTNIINMSQKAVSLLSNENSAMFYAFKTSAVFLFFLLIVMFFLRTFFSVPLIIFHGLNYHDAKALSQKALFKNLRPMSHVMLAWFFVFSITAFIAPMLAIVAMPLFATFCYVAYRHVFLGQGKNAAVAKQAGIATAS